MYLMGKGRPWNVRHAIRLLWVLGRQGNSDALDLLWNYNSAAGIEFGMLDYIRKAQKILEEKMTMPRADGLADQALRMFQIAYYKCSFANWICAEDPDRTIEEEWRKRWMKRLVDRYPGIDREEKAFSEKLEPFLSDVNLIPYSDEGRLYCQRAWSHCAEIILQELNAYPEEDSKHAITSLLLNRSDDVKNLIYAGENVAEFRRRYPKSGKLAQCFRLVNAVSNDDPEGQFNMGMMLMFGLDQNPNAEAMGLCWMLKAAFHKIPMAMFIVAEAYRTGIGVDRDMEESERRCAELEASGVDIGKLKDRANSLCDEYLLKHVTE